MESIIRGRKQKPVEHPAGQAAEVVIVRGEVRTPKSAFDRRPECGPAPTYVGASKMESRNTSAGMGYGQRKKHKSTGKGQS